VCQTIGGVLRTEGILLHLGAKNLVELLRGVQSVPINHPTRRMNSCYTAATEGSRMDYVYVAGVAHLILNRFRSLVPGPL
jgi:hypothetical protein